MSDLKKGNLLKSLKEKASEREEQLMMLSVIVRFIILTWSGIILTLAYVELPPVFRIPKQDLDPTFIASVFTGVLATFGVQTNKGKRDGITKDEFKELIELAATIAPSQTIKIEPGPFKVEGTQIVSEKKDDGEE